MSQRGAIKYDGKMFRLSGPIQQLFGGMEKEKKLWRLDMLLVEFGSLAAHVKLGFNCSKLGMNRIDIFYLAEILLNSVVYSGMNKLGLRGVKLVWDPLPLSYLFGFW